MKLSTALKLGRVSNLPTVWSNVLAGMVLAGATTWPELVPFSRLGVMASLFYVAGMFLNDYCDAEIDAKERPERPIPAGEVEARTVLRWAVALIVAGLALAATLGPPALLGAVATVALIVAYDHHHKGNPLGPLMMGACRVGLYVTAALSVSPTLSAPVLVGGAVLLVYVLGLTYAAAHENTNALVRFGPLVGLWSPVLVARGLLLGSGLGRVLLVGFGLWMVRCLRLVRGGAPASIRAGIVSLIAGIALVDALLIANAGALELAPIAVLAFVATLGLQRWVSGT